MIYLILAVVLVFLIVLFLASYKNFISRDKINKKIKFDFKSGRKVLVGKVIWSIVGTVTVVYAFTLIYPMVWTLINSVKSHSNYLDDKVGFPTDFDFANYLAAFKGFTYGTGVKTSGFLDMLLNSVVYSFGNPLVTVFWVYAVAYVMARFTWFGNKFIYNLGIVLMTITLAGSSASQMVIFNDIGLYDKMYLQILIPPSTAFSGMYFLIVHGSCKGIDQAYTEAARIDGANEYRIMFTIILPMVLPVLCTIYVLYFLTAWNSYESFLVWWKSTPNLALGLFDITRKPQDHQIKGFEVVYACVVIVMIPAMVLYLLTHKIMRSNFVMGGIKG